MGPNSNVCVLMTREQRLRRVLLICCHFARNMAYYRAGWKNKRLIRENEFWVSVNGNCIDIAVLEWCKLFGDVNDSHYWKKVVTDVSNFQSGLLLAIGPGMNMEGFQYYVKKVKQYRDKFVAHLDQDLIAKVPSLDDCWRATQFYFRYILEREGNTFSFLGLPPDINAYYSAKLLEARREYGQET